MLKEVTGDILLSTAGALAHGIAPHDNFKQGLALSLREQWPGMYKDFRHYCQTYNPKPGGAWSWKGPNSPVIINLFTQEPPASDQDRPLRALRTLHVADAATHNRQHTAAHRFDLGQFGQERPQ